ncbi:Neutral/alkaline nonlysosomal ceramidase [Phycomyces nitens]|nr:Neutral/alkaline nonlysosomal ceramidase [Phycomyces nitens]
MLPRTFFLFELLFHLLAGQPTQVGYQVGTGIADITGPIVQIMMMGYAKHGQTGQGLAQRLYSRAYTVVDPVSGNRITIVNTDTQSMGDIVKQRVVTSLQAMYGEDMYTEKNIMLASTHSHSGMGGFLQYTLYEISVLGWIEETVQPMVQGIVKSIQLAHENLQEGSVVYNLGELLDTNINRSPSAYLLNPPEERARYEHDVDKDMSLLGFRARDGQPLGLISWFPVHGVSINNTNRLINGDNKGYAAYAAERLMNPDSLPGKGPFVAAFTQSNGADVSPNTLGAFCTESDIPCDGSRDSICPGSSKCIGRGPGWKIGHFESNRIIGLNQATRALDLFGQKSIDVHGKVDFRQKYWDITKQVVITANGTKGLLCDPAMGYSFAAGTTDGPAIDGFYQNTTQGTFFWDIAKDLVKKPSQKQKECQAPKAILLNTGEIKYPFDWQPKILDVQLLRLGNVYIIGVPSEFSTMSGRRLRRSVKRNLIEQGLGDKDTVVLHTGPANGYASYCTTFEEYQMQRYEGGSTPYGPYTLDAYIKVFEELVTAMASGRPVLDSEQLPNYVNASYDFSPRQGADRPKLFHQFGDVVRNVAPVYKRRKALTVTATFVAGNPRNDGMLDKTYLTVERQDDSGDWKVVKTDDDYDTRFIWRYTMPILGQSEATVEWDCGDAPAGIYRLGYFGHHRTPYTK